MEGENVGENREKNPISPEKRDRVAVCLVCSNEWIARTGTAKKPAKCPVCGTKRCAWKDEMPSEPEKRTETQQKRTETHGEEIEKTVISPGKSGEIEEKTEEKTPEEKNAPGGFPVLLVVAGLVVLGCLAGVGWFLGRRKNHVPAPDQAVFRPPTPAERAMMKMGVVA